MLIVMPRKCDYRFIKNQLNTMVNCKKKKESVCVKERGRERGRETDRQSERDRDRQTNRHNQITSCFVDCDC